MDARGLHLLLVLFLLAMTLLSVAYLRRRQMSFSAFTMWGLLAVLVPAFGPFLVIVLQPGRSALSSR
jgi:hypothetical protein